MRYTQFDYHPAGAVVGHRHDRMSGWWSRHWQGRGQRDIDPRDQPVWATIADVLDRPGRVLEAGCGPAHWVHFLDELGHTTVGVDFAHSALASARASNRCLRLLSGDLRKLPFGDAAFDFIYCGGAVEHDIEGPEAALRELHRVLRPTGRLMCSVPCLSVQRLVLLPWLVLRDRLKRLELLRRLARKTDPFEFYQYVYSPRAYTAILEQCGWDVLDLRPYGTTTESSVVAALTMPLSRLSRFYDTHMMMAICRKQPSRARPA